MAILRNLEELRQAIAAVETVTYMDLGSGTVLGRSSAVDLPQERYDRLAALASEILGGAGGETDEAVLLKPGEALVARRSDRAPAEALCLVCAPDADVGLILDGARRALDGQGT